MKRNTEKHNYTKKIITGSHSGPPSFNLAVILAMIIAGGFAVIDHLPGH